MRLFSQFRLKEVVSLSFDWTRYYTIFLMLTRQSEGDNNHTSSDETDGPVSPGFDQQSAAAAECYPMVIIEETDGHHHIGPPRSGTPSDYLRGGGGATDHHHHHHR